MLGLRSRLLAILVRLPHLISHCSKIHEDHENEPRWDERSESLIQKLSMIFDGVKKWITAEAEPLLLSNATSQQILRGHLEYSDVISGVLDCVANVALLTIGRLMRSLCRARSRSSSLPGRPRPHQLDTSQPLGDRETIEQRRQRAMTAFEFVRERSELAAKPLEFGLQQVHSIAVNGSIDDVDDILN